jgi:transaldolase
VDDVKDALRTFRPLYDSSRGGDGFVSIELSPQLAYDTEGSIQAARELHGLIHEPNLYVKIPATAEGPPAIERMIATGKSINTTLIFGLQRYAEVIDAYICGLERCRSELGGIHSVASFFVSRVDTEVDRLLEDIGTPQALALRGKAAVAQAKLAYQLFKERFQGPRWAKLERRGASVQRPLWASTSTKNPEYADLLYVENLVGPQTVNTMPEATIAAFEDHGRVVRTVDQGLDEATATIEALSRVGIDFEEVSRVLERQGVAAFSKSFDDVVACVQSKLLQVAAL